MTMPHTDAYEGAREDAAIWKKRCLEAEETTRQLTRALAQEVNGPTFIGEPVTITKETAIELARQAGHEYDGEDFVEFVHHLCNLAIAHSRKDAEPVGVVVDINGGINTASRPPTPTVLWTRAIQIGDTLFTHPAHDDTALLRQALDVFEFSSPTDENYIAATERYEDAQDAVITALRERLGE